MYRKEVNERSPLRILERSIHGGLGRGNLGVVMARAGAGSTAFLVQIGLDDLMRDRGVLHVSLMHQLDHVLSWYDALFNDIAREFQLEEREETRARIAKHRVIQAFPDHHLTPQRLERVVGTYKKSMSFNPGAILIDGWDWTGDEIVRAAELGGFMALARSLDAELWMTAQTHRSVVQSRPTRIVPPCETFQQLVSVAVFLEPHGAYMDVRLLKDHDEIPPPDTHLRLNCDTLRIVNDEDAPVRLPPHAYTLLSGGAAGAESMFGEQAERLGLHETNFSFAGREVVRTRGLVELSPAELREGEVSEAYLTAQLHRSFPNTPVFKKMLQTIWHQVATAGEVFVVGTIQADQTVKGGTGWAAELARHMRKPVFVFDQEQERWFTAKDSKWVAIAPPVITRSRFAGTGTRQPNDAAKKAIRELFDRSFGA